MYSQPWHFNLAGRTRKVKQRRIKIEKQLSEVTDDSFVQRNVLTLARYLDGDQEEIMLKVRYDLEPEESDLEDLDQMKELAKREYIEELDTVRAVQEIGQGPEYITHSSQTAGESFPYPKGRVHFIVMSRVKGENVAEIQDLSFDELEDIRAQLARIMEYLRQEWKLLYSQDPNNLRYDRDERKLYFINFTYIQLVNPETDLPDPITPDSLFVLSYDLWSDSHLKKARENASRAKKGCF